MRIPEIFWLFKITLRTFDKTQFETPFNAGLMHSIELNDVVLQNRQLMCPFIAKKEKQHTYQVSKLSHKRNDKKYQPMASALQRAKDCLCGDAMFRDADQVQHGAVRE